MEKKLSRLLGLSSQERRVIQVLDNVRWQSVAAITRKSRIARTSVIRALTKLHKRGLAATLRQGKRMLWQNHYRDVQALSLVSSPSSDIRIHRGLEGMKNLYIEACTHPKGRLLVIQPGASIKMVAAKVSYTWLEELNEKIKRHDVLMESVIQESEFARVKPTFTDELLKSLEGRMASQTTVKDELIEFGAELFITKNKAYLLDWAAETGVVISNIQMVEMLTSYFRLLQSTGRKIDFNEEIRKYLRKER